MHTIVGLGNHGKEYEHTRHNIGWIVLQEILTKKAFPEFSRSSRYSGLLAEGSWDGIPVGVLLPTTYMNNSGNAVAPYVKEKGSLDTLILVHDEVDLPFGEVKVSVGRGAAGHNGVKSVIDACGGNGFTRLRIGIAERGFFGGIKRPKGDELGDFVLKRLSSRELKAVPDLAEKIEGILSLILSEGVESAMQQYN